MKYIIGIREMCTVSKGNFQSDYSILKRENIKKRSIEFLSETDHISILSTNISEAGTNAVGDVLLFISDHIGIIKVAAFIEKERTKLPQPKLLTLWIERDQIL